MATMTLEERERRAYANGDVETAALLREAIDPVDDRVQELEWQVESLQSEVDDRVQELEWQVESLQSEVQRLEEEMEEMKEDA